MSIYEPELGDIKKATEIGYKGSIKYIWAACEGCGKERWVHLVGGKPKRLKCQRCSNKRRNWKGKRCQRPDGYIQVWLPPDDFFASMRNTKGYVLEHRLVVARALGRCLHRWEVVHHKDNCPKDDNRYPQTLQLVTDERHQQITLLENRIKLLEQRVLKLEVENALLRERSANVPNL